MDYHQEILHLIQKSTDSKTSQDANYHGTTHKFYGLSSPAKSLIVNEWSANHSDISFPDFVKLLTDLSKGESNEEKTIVGYFLLKFPKLKKEINPQILNDWLDDRVGWVEVDSLCQSTFAANNMLAKWNEWEKLIKSLNQSKNVSKRRASLVLLTKPVKDSEDEKLSNLAFYCIDKLKLEKDILITKAISWLLRNLIKNSREKVIIYIKDNKDILPKLAIRETLNKIKTGKK